MSDRDSRRPAPRRRAEGPARRRRTDSTPRRRPDRAAFTGLVLVLLAAAAVFLTRPAAPAAPPHAVSSGALVRHARLACPQQGAARGATSQYLTGSVPAAGVGSGGRVRAGAVGSPGSPVQLNRGSMVQLPKSVSGPQISADGDIAAGLFGYRVDSGTTQAVAPCAAPRASWWFTGPAATLDHSSTLVMTNVDPGPAVVDLKVLGPHGPVSTVGTRGITIAPGSRKTVPLAGVAPQTGDAAVEVHASRGRVVAAMSDSFAPRAGANPGAEWLPDQTLPSRVVRLAGLPAKADQRTLLVSNPSSLEAIVGVQVQGANGGFTPAGLDAIQVAPGTVQSVDVTKAVGNEATAVRLHSQVPVTASVRSTTAADSTYAAPVLPLAGPAAAPLVQGAAGTVQVTAGELPAQVRFASYTAGGHRLDGGTKTIRPKTTVTWTPAKRAAYVVVTPVKGAVYGALSLSGAGVSEVPLTTLPIRFQEPPVLPATS
ncbi:MAG: DUF5719 family protein [Nocardioidaceae bacterium]